MRIGNGYDAHRLVAARPLIIGGVDIDWHWGLAGHSDADVLLHALCDACIGAAGHGDLGRHFPSSNPSFQDVDSRVFVRATRRRLAEDNWRVVNLDCTVVAQRPALAPYTARMEANIAEDLGMDASLVNVKATTTDGLGFCGSEQGIAAFVVALLDTLEG